MNKIRIRFHLSYLHHCTEYPVKLSHFFNLDSNYGRTIKPNRVIHQQFSRCYPASRWIGGGTRGGVAGLSRFALAGAGFGDHRQYAGRDEFVFDRPVAAG